MPSYDDECFNLPELEITKQRVEAKGWRETQPFTGPLIIEQVSDDTPVYWNASVTCGTNGQAQRFQLFLNLTGDDGVKIKNGGTFTKNILTEFGFIQHTVNIIGEIPRPSQLNNKLFKYSFTIYARSFDIGEVAECWPELLFYYADDASTIDCAINSFLPG